MSMSAQQMQQTMQAYTDALFHHGDFAQYFSDDVVCSAEGTDQRYQGREVVRQWLEGSHSLGEIKFRDLFSCEGHAAAEAEFIRNDGRVVPYSVVYDLADGKITALRLYFTGPVQD